VASEFVEPRLSPQGRGLGMQLLATHGQAGAHRWPRGLKAYAAMHGIWLVLYALLGKGFAYAGWQPFYVSELLLLFSFIALCGTGRIGSLLRTPLGCIMACFLAWQLACMVPYLGTFGVDSLRDSAIWGYATFAWMSAALVLRLPSFLEVVVRKQYWRFAKVYVFFGAAAWLATLYLQEWLPHWPGTAVSIPLIKGGEYCVHMAGILAFVLSGLAGSSQLWAFMILADAMLGMSVRGGLLAFLVASSCVLLLRARFDRLVLVLGSSLLVVVAMAAFDIRLGVPGTAREFSLDQLSDNLTSVIGDSDRRDLEGTKNWRIAWWRTIREYTVNGAYFWTGKGYGVNLADSDGFQVGTRDEPLRSPHSSHMTFLARSGVPGLLLWITLQGSWAALMLVSYIRARQCRLAFWSSLFAWLLAYWVAFMVSASFDVFLEGPMAGIPFWTLFGLGWGSEITFRSRVRKSHAWGLVDLGQRRGFVENAGG